MESEALKKLVRIIEPTTVEKKCATLFAAISIIIAVGAVLSYSQGWGGSLTYKVLSGSSAGFFVLSVSAFSLACFRNRDKSSATIPTKGENPDLDSKKNTQLKNNEKDQQQSADPLNPASSTQPEASNSNETPRENSSETVKDQQQSANQPSPTSSTPPEVSNSNSNETPRENSKVVNKNTTPPSMSAKSPTKEKARQFCHFIEQFEGSGDELADILMRAGLTQELLFFKKTSIFDTLVKKRTCTEIIPILKKLNCSLDFSYDGVSFGDYLLSQCKQTNDYIEIVKQLDSNGLSLDALNNIKFLTEIAYNHKEILQIFIRRKFSLKIPHDFENRVQNLRKAIKDFRDDDSALTAIVSANVDPIVSDNPTQETIKIMFNLLTEIKPPVRVLRILKDSNLTATFHYEKYKKTFFYALLFDSASSKEERFELIDLASQEELKSKDDQYNLVLTAILKEDFELANKLVQTKVKYPEIEVHNALIENRSIDAFKFLCSIKLVNIYTLKKWSNFLNEKGNLNEYYTAFKHDIELMQNWCNWAYENKLYHHIGVCIQHNIFPNPLTLEHCVNLLSNIPSLDSGNVILLLTNASLERKVIVRQKGLGMQLLRQLAQKDRVIEILESSNLFSLAVLKELLLMAPRPDKIWMQCKSLTNDERNEVIEWAKEAKVAIEPKNKNEGPAIKSASAETQEKINSDKIQTILSICKMIERINEPYEKLIEKLSGQITQEMLTLNTKQGSILDKLIEKRGYETLLILKKLGLSLEIKHEGKSLVEDFLAKCTDSQYQKLIKNLSLEDLGRQNNNQLLIRELEKNRISRAERLLRKGISPVVLIEHPQRMELIERIVKSSKDQNVLVSFITGNLTQSDLEDEIGHKVITALIQNNHPNFAVEILKKCGFSLVFTWKGQPFLAALITDELLKEEDRFQIVKRAQQEELTENLAIWAFNKKSNRFLLAILQKGIQPNKKEITKLALESGSFVQFEILIRHQLIEEEALPQFIEKFNLENIDDYFDYATEERKRPFDNNHKIENSKQSISEINSYVDPGKIQSVFSVCDTIEKFQGARDDLAEKLKGQITPELLVLNTEKGSILGQLITKKGYYETVFILKKLGLSLEFEFDGKKILHLLLDKCSDAEYRDVIKNLSLDDLGCQSDKNELFIHELEANSGQRIACLLAKGINPVISSTSPQYHKFIAKVASTIKDTPALVKFLSCNMSHDDSLMQDAIQFIMNPLIQNLGLYGAVEVLRKCNFDLKFLWTADSFLANSIINDTFKEEDRLKVILNAKANELTNDLAILAFKNNKYRVLDALLAKGVQLNKKDAEEIARKSGSFEQFNILVKSKLIDPDKVPEFLDMFNYHNFQTITSTALTYNPALLEVLCQYAFNQGWDRSLVIFYERNIFPKAFSKEDLLDFMDNKGNITIDNKTLVNMIQKSGFLSSDILNLKSKHNKTLFDHLVRRCEGCVHIFQECGLLDLTILKQILSWHAYHHQSIIQSCNNLSQTDKNQLLDWVLEQEKPNLATAECLLDLKASMSVPVDQVKRQQLISKIMDQCTNTSKKVAWRLISEMKLTEAEWKRNIHSILNKIGSLDLIQILDAQGIQLSTLDERGIPFVHVLIKNIDFARASKERCISILQPYSDDLLKLSDSNNETLLHWSLYQKQILFASALLERVPELINVNNPFVAAISSIHDEKFLNNLIDKLPNVDWQNEAKGDSYLHMAVRAGNYNAVNCLLLKKVNRQLKNLSGLTASDVCSDCLKQAEENKTFNPLEAKAVILQFVNISKLLVEKQAGVRIKSGDSSDQKASCPNFDREETIVKDVTKSKSNDQANLEMLFKHLNVTLDDLKTNNFAVVKALIAKHYLVAVPILKKLGLPMATMIDKKTVVQLILGKCFTPSEYDQILHQLSCEEIADNHFITEMSNHQISHCNSLIKKGVSARIPPNHSEYIELVTRGFAFLRDEALIAFIKENVTQEDLNKSYAVGMLVIETLKLHYDINAIIKILKTAGFDLAFKRSGKPFIISLIQEAEYCYSEELNEIPDLVRLEELQENNSEDNLALFAFNNNHSEFFEKLLKKGIKFEKGQGRIEDPLLSSQE